MKVGTTALGDDDRRGCTITKPPVAGIRCSTEPFDAAQRIHQTSKRLYSTNVVPLAIEPKGYYKDLRSQVPPDAMQCRAQSS